MKDEVFNMLSVMDIQQTYGFQSFPLTLDFLIKKNFKVFLFIDTENEMRILKDENDKKSMPYVNQNMFMEEVLKEDENYYYLKPLPMIYQVDFDILYKEMVLRANENFDCNVHPAILRRIDSITFNTYVNLQVTRENFLVWKPEIDTYLGDPQTFYIEQNLSKILRDYEESRHLEYRHEDESYDKLIVARNFSYLVTKSEEKIELTGIRQEIFQIAFELHHERYGKEFKSGEIMNALSRPTKYKGLGDFLGKNKDIAQYFEKINNLGVYRMKLPLFGEFINHRNN